MQSLLCENVRLCVLQQFNSRRPSLHRWSISDGCVLWMLIRLLSLQLLWLVVSLIGQHGCISRPCLDHHVCLLVWLSLHVLFDSIIRDLFLSISDSAQVRAPCDQAETHDQVEQNYVCHEPPIEIGWFSPALVLSATPDLHLDEEHRSTDEEVECEEESLDLFQVVRHLDYLEK